MAGVATRPLFNRVGLVVLDVRSQKRLNIIGNGEIVV